MEEKIRNHVNQIFTNVEDSQRVRELKEELIANLTEKWRDLAAGGASEEEAYRRVIQDAGDASDYGFVPKWTSGEEREQYNGMQIRREAYVDTPVNAVDLNWCVGGVQILKSTDDRVHLVQKAHPDLPESCLFSYGVSGGALWIRDNNSGVRRGGFGRILAPKDTYLTCRLPQKVYDAVTITSASGYVRGERLEASLLSTKNASGSVRLYGSFREVRSSNSSGKTEIGSWVPARVTLTNASGKSLLQGQFTSADLKNASGTIEFITGTPCAARVQCSSGRFTAHGPLEDLSLNLSSGKAQLESDSMPKRLDLLLSSGVAELRFPENPEGFSMRVHKTSGTVDSEFSTVKSGHNWIYGKGKANFGVNVTSGLFRLVRR